MAVGFWRKRTLSSIPRGFCTIGGRRQCEARRRRAALPLHPFNLLNRQPGQFVDRVDIISFRQHSLHHVELPFLNPVFDALASSLVLSLALIPVPFLVGFPFSIPRCSYEMMSSITCFASFVSIWLTSFRSLASSSSDNRKYVSKKAEQQPLFRLIELEADEHAQKLLFHFDLFFIIPHFA